MDWSGYLAARDLAGRLGPWLIWPAVLASWAAVLLSSKPRGNGEHQPAAAGLAATAAFAFMAASAALVAWYHWRIYLTVSLELPGEIGAWINAQLAGAGRGGLPPVDWERPPRFAIPPWIEGEKFWFWSLVSALVVFVEGRRRSHAGYLLTLRLMLALQLTGMAVWDNPFGPPLPQFHREVAAWIGAEPVERAGLFFNLYPRMRFYYNAAYMWLHPPMLFIAYATLAGTFAASLFTLGRQDQDLDQSAYDYARVGYILLTIGMLVGYPWAIIAWGPNWWWDPKIAASLMMWLLYSAYLHHRFLASHRGGRLQIAALGILCYLSLLFTYFMSWYFPGEHTF